MKVLEEDGTHVGSGKASVSAPQPIVARQSAIATWQPAERHGTAAHAMVVQPVGLNDIVVFVVPFKIWLPFACLVPCCRVRAEKARAMVPVRLA